MRRGQAGADRPADLALDARAVGLEVDGEQAAGEERGQQRGRLAGHGMGAALDAVVGIEQPRGVERLVRAGGRGEQREAGVEQLDVGVEEDGHVGARALDPRVVGGAEPRVVGQVDHLGAAFACQLGAAVARARVDDDELRALREVVVHRAEEDREVRRRVVDHDHRGERRPAHVPAAAASAARVSRAARSQESSAMCCAPASASPRRSRSSAASARSASASAPASPGRV